MKIVQLLVQQKKTTENCHKYLKSKILGGFNIKLYFIARNQLISLIDESTCI